MATRERSLPMTSAAAPAEKAPRSILLLRESVQGVGLLIPAVLILLAGLQGRSWAIWADLAVQLIPIAGFAVYPGVGLIGLLFAAVWALIALVLRSERRSPTA